MKVIIAGGGTGGHLMPGLAVAGELRRRDPKSRILFVGSARGIEAHAVPPAGFELVVLSVGGFQRTGWIRRIRNLGAMVWAFLKSLSLVGRFRPDVAVGLGGYASFPVMAASWFWAVPGVLMEQNVFPGLANRLLGRRAKFVAVPDARAARHFPGRAVVTGNPVRPEFKRIGPRPPMNGRPCTVLVTGGSQGAESINRAVIEALKDLGDWKARLRFVHQTGRRQVEEVRAAYAAAGFEAEVSAFFADMERRFEAADLLIARAGATTVAEVQAAGRTALFIPLPYAADDHQRKNARAMVEHGAAAMIDPDELSGPRLAGEIRRLLGDPALLERMEANARKGAILDAEARIADLIEQAAGARLSRSNGIEQAHSAIWM